MTGMTGSAHMGSLPLDNCTRAVNGSKIDKFCSNYTWEIFSDPFNFISKIARLLTELPVFVF